VATEERNFVLFKNDLFLFRQRDEDIDALSVGGDCAAWIYMRLFPSGCIGPLQDPCMEDWKGWTFDVSVSSVAARRVTVNINVWPYFVENHWLLGIYPRNRIFGRHPPDALLAAKEIVGDEVEKIIVADSRFEKHRWFAENPFELQIEGL
jgi:hypothetical protein